MNRPDNVNRPDNGGSNHPRDTIDVCRVSDSEPFVLPTRHHAGDCGYDLYISCRTVVPARRFADAPVNARVALPPGTWGLIMGRSSTLRKRGLLVLPAIIDNGYRGPLFSGVYNLNGKEVVLEVGDRVAQLIVMSLVTPDVCVVNELPGGDGRGEAGFGSTGV